jgi:hypothetical protein
MILPWGERGHFYCALQHNAHANVRGKIIKAIFPLKSYA